MLTVFNKMETVMSESFLSSVDSGPTFNAKRGPHRPSRRSQTPKTFHVRSDFFSPPYEGYL